VTSRLGTGNSHFFLRCTCRWLAAVILASDHAVAGLPVLLAYLRVGSVLPDSVLSEVGVSAVAGVLALAATILIASGDYLLEVL
jgi:hypothetical protein